MTYSVKIINYQNSQMLNICDLNLLGTELSGGDHCLNITKSYYGDRTIDEKEATSLLQNSAIINMVGKNIISLSIKLGIGSEKGVKKINDVPFLIIFKM